MSRRRQSENGDAVEAAEPPRGLPLWMRLYFYGMHGVTLDVLLSAARGFVDDRDPKLVGFSSASLCVLHALSHLALESLYSRRTRFPCRPVTFHLVLYPSVYVGLQVLIGTVHAGELRAASAALLAAHYVVALYFTGAFHRWMSRLRYHPSCAVDPLRGPARDVGHPRGLPGAARFLFFGMHGLVDEVLFTAAFNVVERSDRTLGGHTSLWSFLIYGSCSAVVERIYYHLHFGRGWGACRRLPLYVGCIYTWELAWGLALRQFDACSWDYSHYPHNFMGLITLVYLPGWVCISLYQDVLSNVLLRIKCEGDAGLRGEDAGLRGEDAGLRGRPESKDKLL